MQEPTFRYIDRAEVCRLRGIGKSKQFEDEKLGKFPAGERHGTRTVRWRSDVVANWLEAESQKIQKSSEDIGKLQSEISRKGVEARRKKRMASSAELAGQA